MEEFEISNPFEINSPIVFDVPKRELSLQQDSIELQKQKLIASKQFHWEEYVTNGSIFTKQLLKNTFITKFTITSYCFDTETNQFIRFFSVNSITSGQISMFLALRHMGQRSGAGGAIQSAMYNETYDFIPPIQIYRLYNADFLQIDCTASNIYSSAFITIIGYENDI